MGRASNDRGSSSLEQIVHASVGDVLRDRGSPVEIDDLLDLGTIDFGSSSLELWDPIQVQTLHVTVTVPARRARAFAALSGHWARSLKLTFSSNAVTAWRQIGEAAGPYGTLVLSRVGPRAEIAKLEFETSFWEDVFDEAFDPADGAAIVELQVGKHSVPLLAWNDCQMGGTLFTGHDAQGRLAVLFFDGVRVSLPDGPE